MLQELFLSLSGHNSPLLRAPPDLKGVSTGDSTEDSTGESIADGDQSGPDSFLRPAFTQAELALLSSLATDLGAKHKSITNNVNAILSASPSSTSAVCKVVAAAIKEEHLASFQARLLELEQNILEETSDIVGANGAVPLSAIVGGLDGWSRRLGFLVQIVDRIQSPARDNSRGQHSQPSSFWDGATSTASLIIDHLRNSTKTGFPDVKAIALDLLGVAEKCWLRQLSAWILYGRYPDGCTDFLVTRKGAGSRTEDLFAGHSVNMELAPGFVTADTAGSILFIGTSLQSIRQRRIEVSGLQQEGAINSSLPDLVLLREHLQLIAGLKSPISSNEFKATIGAIRVSLSKSSLQKLLPIEKVSEILTMLRDYFLLENADFAIALVTAADERVDQRAHHTRAGPRNTGRSLDSSLANLTIKEGEVHSILARAWTTLARFQHSIGDEDATDEELDRVRSLLRLSIKSSEAPVGKSLQHITAPSFDDLLLPAPTILSLRLCPPFDLFLGPSDVSTYSYMHAYLLAIRRAQFRLSGLSLLSRLRRDDNSSLTSSTSAPIALPGARTRSLRTIWASIAATSSLFSELNTYFHGEVIPSSWSSLHLYLDPTNTSRPSTSSSTGTQSTLQTSLSSSRHQPAEWQHDPQSLPQAHRSYVDALYFSLLLSETSFTAPLRKLMTTVEHAVALMRRLDNIVAMAKAVVSTSSNTQGIEIEEVMHQLQAVAARLRQEVQDIKDCLKTLAESDDDDETAGGHSMPLEGEFRPWRAGRRGLEMLVGKFQ